MLQAETLFLLCPAVPTHPLGSSRTANPGLGFPSVPGQCWGSRVRADGKTVAPDDALHPSFSKWPGGPAPAGSSPTHRAFWALAVAFLSPPGSINQYTSHAPSWDTCHAQHQAAKGRQAPLGKSQQQIWNNRYKSNFNCHEAAMRKNKQWGDMGRFDLELCGYSDLGAYYHSDPIATD